MPKRGGIRKKRRTHQNADIDDEEHKQAPKFFVLKRTHVTRGIKELISDWRQVVSPYCAMKLKESSHNKVRDFVSVSSIFGVTHIVTFSQTDRAPYMKFMRLPQGPTLTFKILEFSPACDVRANQSKTVPVYQSLFQNSPIAVMHGFRNSGTKNNSFPLELLSTFIGNMFKKINIYTLSPSKCRRVVLFHFDKETQNMSIRHYAINQRQAGVSETIRHLLKLRTRPAEFLSTAAKDLTEAIAEQGNEQEENASAVDVNKTSENNAMSKVILGLHELGPRIDVELVKIESDVGVGKVLYHSYKSKTPEEIAELEAKEYLFKCKRERDAKELEQVNCVKKQHKAAKTQHNIKDDLNGSSDRCESYNDE